MSNTVLLLIVAATGGIGATVAYYKMKHEEVERHVEKNYDLDTLLVYIKYNMAEIVKEDDEDYYALDEEEYDAKYARRNVILMALKNSVYGIDSAKIIVQELMREMIVKVITDVPEAMQIINFKDIYLSSRVKFEVMMYFYKKKYGKDALPKFIDEFDLANEKVTDDGKCYYIDDEDIDSIYRKLNYDLDYDQMIDIITIIEYEAYKGFRIIDTIREMNIDGIDVGVSGSLTDTGNLLTTQNKAADPLRCVWVQYHGRYIHFVFLKFKSETEIACMTNALIKFNSQGSLTEDHPYKYSSMYDKSRVTVVRPPTGQCYGVFMRKFTLKVNTLEWLLNPKKKDKDETGAQILIPKYTNAELPIKIASYLMKGQRTVAVTGRQSSGKTTTMKAMVSKIDPRLNIGVLETIPELYLRSLYPTRNIYEAQETDHVTTTEIQNFLKKADRAVSIVGEVATAEMAARMLEMSKVASLFTIFSHHAISSADLVRNLRNNVVTIVPGTPASVAEALVVDAIPFDYHQDFNESGDRFIDRVTEIIPLSEGVPYPRIKPNDTLLSIAELIKEYFTRRTDRSSFTTRDIMRFDKTTYTYKAVNMWSASSVKNIVKCLPSDEVDNFLKFVHDNWMVR